MTVGQKLGGTYYDYFGDSDSRREKIASLGKIQRSILKIVEGEEGISQKELVKRLGRSKQLISYHVRKLDRAGLVRREESGEGSPMLYVAD